MSTARPTPVGDEVLIVLDDPDTTLPALIRPWRFNGFAVPRMRREPLEHLHRWLQQQLHGPGGSPDEDLVTRLDPDGTFRAGSHADALTILPDSAGYYDLADLGQRWTLVDLQPAPLDVVRALIASAVDEWPADTGVRVAARLYATRLVDKTCEPVDEPDDVPYYAAELGRLRILAKSGVRKLTLQAREMAVSAINGLALPDKGWMRWDFDRELLDAFGVDHDQVTAALAGDVHSAAQAFLAVDEYLDAPADPERAEAFGIAATPEIPWRAPSPESRPGRRRDLLDAIETAIIDPGAFIRRGSDPTALWQARAAVNILKFHRPELAATVLTDRPLYEWAGESPKSGWTGREALGALAEKLLTIRAHALMNRETDGTRLDGLDEAARLARLFAFHGPSVATPTF